MSLFKNVKAIWNEAGYQCRLLGEVIYPRRCAVCRQEIDTGYFCETCRKNFLLDKFSQQVENLDWVLMLYKYQQELQQAIHNVKFAGQRDLLPLLREEAQFACGVNLQSLLADVDIITHIPTSPERKEQRGFDVPQEIFAFLENKKLQPDLLKRVRNTLPLFDLEPNLRQQEVAGCFEVQQAVMGKSILICDDIFTTGSTMYEAARVLRMAGARSVSALSFTASKDNW